MLSERAPFRMSLHHSQLGDPVFEVVSAPKADLGESLPPLPTRTPHDEIVDRLDTIITLLEEAADRSFPARCRRLWAWIRTRVRF